MVRFYFLILLLCLGISCMRNKGSEMDGLKKNQCDSSYFTFTAQQLISNGFDRLHYFSLVEERGYLINVYTDEIYYSPDSLKALSFQILEVPSGSRVNQLTLPEGSGEFSYSAFPMVGFRKSVDSMWLLYPVPSYFVSNGLSYENIKYEIQRQYFNNLKEDNNDCVPTDSCFWTAKNKLWLRDGVIPGYYSFQVKSSKSYYDMHKEDKETSNFLFNLPKLVYPDSILDCYMSAPPSSLPSE